MVPVTLVLSIVITEIHGVSENDKYKPKPDKLEFLIDLIDLIDITWRSQNQNVSIWKNGITYSTTPLFFTHDIKYKSQPFD
jgi:hypothetical protein